MLSLLLVAHLALSPLASLPIGVAPGAQQAEDEVAAATEALLKAQDEASLDTCLLDLEEVASDEQVKAALGAKRAAVCEAIASNSSLKKLARLAERRTELDAARSAALGLIRDEKRYFKPYKVPEVSADRAQEYQRTQREIEGLTEEVEDLWESRSKVKLSKKLVAKLRELEWTRQRLSDLAPRRRRRRSKEEEPVQDALPAGLPSWVEGLPVDGTVVNLQTFAWTAKERERLALDRAVALFNEECLAWAQKAKRELAEDERPSKQEAEQVRVTNAYRTMLGERALAWHPKIQAATDGHSDYMAKVGKLTHFQEGVDATYDFGKRTKLAGYQWGRGENCSYGLPDPKATHAGWKRSSGHHRNLLNPGHREMASAVAGPYWTQNFGGRAITLEEATDWQSRFAKRD